MKTDIAESAKMEGAVISGETNIEFNKINTLHDVP